MDFEHPLFGGAGRDFVVEQPISSPFEGIRAQLARRLAPAGALF
jgi:hypothetical protein